MSDESHDQLKSSETPDTAPSRMRILVLGLVAYLLVACMTYIFYFGLSPDIGELLVSETGEISQAPNQGSQVERLFPASAYLRSESSSDLIDPQLGIANLVSANDSIELATLLGTNPAINVIFIDSKMLEEADGQFLQSRYKNGDVLVGLRIDHSRLSSFLGVEPTIDDLTNDAKLNSAIWVSIHHAGDEPDSQIAAAYTQFPTLISDVHNLR